MGEPKVSVIIPAYNEEKYIGRALTSSNNQTYPNIETIVVSNGSTDKTVEIAEEYTEKVYRGSKRGISKARNIGIELASGDIITFLDADSYMEKTLIEKAIQAMNEYYVGGKAKVIPDKKYLSAKLYYDYVNFCSRLSSLLTKYDKSLLNGAGAFMFTDRKRIERLKWRYKKVFDESLETMEDVDFLRKLRKEGELKFITDSYVKTSTRRLENEGVLKTFIMDYIEYLFPRGKKKPVCR